MPISRELAHVWIEGEPILFKASAKPSLTLSTNTHNCDTWTLGVVRVDRLDLEYPPNLKELCGKRITCTLRDNDRVTGRIKKATKHTESAPTFSAYGLYVIEFDVDDFKPKKEIPMITTENPFGTADYITTNAPGFLRLNVNMSESIDKQFRKLCTIHLPLIKKIYFDNPYTIVEWEDGEKTKVCATDADEFDEEVGLAMAIARRYCEKTGAGEPRGYFKRLIEDAQVRHSHVKPTDTDDDN